jgi:hypothetical protein
LTAVKRDVSSSVSFKIPMAEFDYAEDDNAVTGSVVPFSMVGEHPRHESKNRKKISEDVLKMIVPLLKNSTMSVAQVGKQFQIPLRTLYNLREKAGLIRIRKQSNKVVSCVLPMLSETLLCSPIHLQAASDNDLEGLRAHLKPGGRRKLEPAEATEILNKLAQLGIHRRSLYNFRNAHHLVRTRRCSNKVD